MENDEKRSDGSVRLTHIPHKFCPNCGHRNDASLDVCEQCGKDISWIKVPEQTPIIHTPAQKPRSLPKGEPVFSRRAIIVAILIGLLLAGLIVAIVFLGRSKSKDSGMSVTDIMEASLLRQTCLLTCFPSGCFIEAGTAVSSTA